MQRAINNLLIVGLGGLAVYLFLKSRKQSATTTTQGSTTQPSWSYDAYYPPLYYGVYPYPYPYPPQPAPPKPPSGGGGGSTPPPTPPTPPSGSSGSGGSSSTGSSSFVGFQGWGNVK